MGLTAHHLCYQSGWTELEGDCLFCSTCSFSAVSFSRTSAANVNDVRLLQIFKSQVKVKVNFSVIQKKKKWSVWGTSDFTPVIQSLIAHGMLAFYPPNGCFCKLTGCLSPLPGPPFSFLSTHLFCQRLIGLEMIQFILTVNAVIILLFKNNRKKERKRI